MTKDVENQIKRMLGQGQKLPKYFCAFSDEQIIKMFRHAKRIQETRVKT